MISFDVVTENRLCAISENLKNKLGSADFEYVEDVLRELCAIDDGCEYAVSASDGCLLVRVFEDEYFFLFPEPVSEDYNVIAAIDAMRLYSIREEIPLVISEVPEEWVEDVAGVFKKSEVVPEDESGERYTLYALSEISQLDELPTLCGNRLSLTPIAESDVKEYARLCRDSETNKYWGYDYARDCSAPSDEYFLQSVLSELSRGVCAPFAIRLDGELIGEALFYAFDLLGGAECAVRLLPEYRERGLSYGCLELLCDAAEAIGLCEIYATVDKRNIPSIRLFEKKFELFDSTGDIIRFLLKM